MQRVATLMLVKDGREEEYREAHREVWPEILEGIRRAGIRNYDIVSNHVLDHLFYGVRGDVALGGLHCA